MKVLVIGATGKTGKNVVEQAVIAGHEVTTFVHETKGYLPDSSVLSGVSSPCQLRRFC